MREQWGSGPVNMKMEDATVKSLHLLLKRAREGIRGLVCAVVAAQQQDRLTQPKWR